MFYSSLLFHKEVNFTLKNYFNQLFSRLPNPPSYSSISTEISVFGRMTDQQKGIWCMSSHAKLGTCPQGGESKHSADKSRLGGKMMP
jgi:hypothetical protein